MDPDILIPASGEAPIPRLDEYAGIWLVEPARSLACWHAAAWMDLRQHVILSRDDQRQPGGSLRPRPAEKISTHTGQSISVIRMSGLLMKQRSSLGGTSTIDLRREIREAARDRDTSAILLVVDSPGGTAAGTDDLARDIREARRQKLVWAHIDDLCASAAYWAASQAGQLFAGSPTALIGSIGTYLTVYDVSEATARDGIRTLHITTGFLKGTGTPGTVVTEEQRAYLQAIVDSIQSEFDAAVQMGRGMSAIELAAVRSGGVYPAREALRLRLIDGIRSLDATIDALADAISARKRVVASVI